MDAVMGVAKRSNKAFVLFCTFFYAAWIARVVVLLPVDAALHDPWVKQVWSQGIRVLLWVVPVFVYLIFVERVNPVQFLKLNRLPRGRGLNLTLTISVLFLAVMAVCCVYLQGGKIDRLYNKSAQDWLLLVGPMFVVSLSEEIVFRGLFFQKLTQTLRKHQAVLLSALLFVLVHVPGWLYMQGPSWHLLQLSGSIFVVGCVLAVVFDAGQSLWPPIALHLLNNVIAASLSS